MLYPLVDVLRAVAALLVVVYHVMALGQLSVFPDSLWGLPFRNGWIGVDLFLVISGFVITLSAAREWEKNPEGFGWRFMQRRFKRLLPLYALTCIVFVFLVRPEILMRPTDQVIHLFVSHIFFFSNLSPDTHGVFNGVTWSLGLEMQFYVALVFGIGWLLKLGAWRALLGLVVMSLAWRYGTTFVLKPGEAIPHLQVIYTTQLPGTLDAFGMGIALALLVVKGQGFWARRVQQGWQNCLVWVVLAGCLLWLAGALFVPRANYWSHTGMVVFWRTILAAGFGAALGAVITCPLRGGGLFRPLRYLGQISYGIYLWHFAVLQALLTQPTLRGDALFVVMTGTLLLSAMSWHLMEKHWISTPSR